MGLADALSSLVILSKAKGPNTAGSATVIFKEFLDKKTGRHDRRPA